MCPQLICIIGFGRMEARHGKMSYPTVVMLIKAHQKPSYEPLVKEQGNSSFFT